MRNDEASVRLQSTLDDLKRRLQQERAAAETLTHHLTTQRDQGRVVEESRVRKLESELAAAQRQWASQGERIAAEELVQQLAGERDELRMQLSLADARIHAVEQELAVAHSRLDTQSRASEELIQQLTTEREDTRTQLNEVERRTRALEQEFAATQEQFREQREAAVQVIRQLEGERDEGKATQCELEARTQWLEEELAVARELLLEAVREMQMQSQRLLEQIRGRGSLAPLAGAQKELAEAATPSIVPFPEPAPSESAAS